MKHLLTLLITFGALSYAYGQNGQNGQSINNAPADSINIQILNELKSIHQFQIDEQAQRKKDIDEWRGKGDKKIQEESPSDIGMMAKIEGNTRQHPLRDGWNLYGWIAFAIALASAFIAMITLREQSKTEKHTQKAPKDAQLGVLKDLPRHFYRNLACTCAAHYKFRSQTTRKKYPSEANILKLTTLPDEFILPIDSSSDMEYKKMHEEKLLFKNYNLEIEVAAKHFALQSISDDSLANDYDNLLFNPLFLTTRMLELQDLIARDGKSGSINGVVYAIYAFVKEHFEKVNFKAFIENKNDEVRLLEAIINDSDFAKRIGVKDDSISRSIKMLLKYKKSDPDVVNFLTRKRVDDDEFSGTGEVLLDSEGGFIEFFNKQYSLESVNGSTKGLDSFRKVLKVQNEDDFSKVFNGGESTANTSNAYKALSFYFTFMNKKNWDVNELLLTMLKIDSVLEMSKIGMIEY